MSTPGVLLSSCARAASAAETAYRIDAPIAPARAARVVALDEGAAEVARRVAADEWTSARFFVCDGVTPGNGSEAMSADDLVLRGIDGTPASLDEQMIDADVVVLIATEDAGAASASIVGRSCFESGVMTAGVVLGNGLEADEAVAALRPHARVLLPFADDNDVIELLTALRA